MSRLLRHLRVSILLLGTPAPGLLAQVGVQPAVAPSPGIYTAAVEESRTLVWDRMAEVGIPGLSVAVAVDGEVVWAEGFGMADLENSVAVRPDTRFRIASISKALTAAAVGVLVQEGRLDLDAPVQNYVPSFPLKRWPVTTRQLGGHVAGVRHYRGEEFASSVHYDDVVEALAIFEADTLLFEPRTDYSYSTYGWNLVSAVIQGASGRPFLRYMRDEVLDPLDLDETVAEHVDSIIPGRARFYLQGENRRIVNAPFVDNSNKWAGGGYLCGDPLDAPDHASRRVHRLRHRVEPGRGRRRPPRLAHRRCHGGEHDSHPPSRRRCRRGHSHQPPERASRRTLPRHRCPLRIGRQPLTLTLIPQARI
jgi:CubicO group peptidase (beta-lactamase class C family)